MNDDRPPNLEERYGKAIGSKRLQVETDRRCDVDMLVAAGWLTESIGTELFRLRQEFDAARGEYLQAKQVTAGLWTVVSRLQADERKPLPPSKTHDAHVATRARRLVTVAAMTAAERQALNARALVLVQLKSLHGAKQKLGAFALGLAPQKRYFKPSLHILDLTGRALDFWLDPACPACDGRGFHGGVGTPMEWCDVCGGSKRRVINFGGHDEDQLFGKNLLAAMDRKADDVAGKMKAFLFKRTAEESRESATRELQERLQGLRSTEAQED